MDKKNNIQRADEEQPVSFGEKSNPFVAPKDYFEFLPAQITEKIRGGSSEERPFALKPAWSFASLSIITAAAFALLYFSQPKAPVQQESYVLSENDIDYVIDNRGFYNIEEEDITDQYLSSSREETSLITADISEDDISSYLEETTNATTIINGL